MKFSNNPRTYETFLKLLIIMVLCFITKFYLKKTYIKLCTIFPSIYTYFYFYFLFLHLVMLFGVLSFEAHFIHIQGFHKATLYQIGSLGTTHFAFFHGFDFLPCNSTCREKCERTVFSLHTNQA